MLSARVPRSAAERRNGQGSHTSHEPHAHPLGRTPSCACVRRRPMTISRELRAQRADHEYVDWQSRPSPCWPSAESGIRPRLGSGHSSKPRPSVVETMAAHTPPSVRRPSRVRRSPRRPPQAKGVTAAIIATPAVSTPERSVTMPTMPAIRRRRVQAARTNHRRDDEEPLAGNV